MRPFAAVLALALLPAALPLAAQAPATAPEYVPVSTQPEPGHAPGMQVRQLTPPSQEPAQYVIVFGKGDEVASGLLDFSTRFHVSSAHFTAIGAVADARLGWMDRTRKSYRVIPITTQAEVVSLIGDIALFNGKPAVHTHLVVGMEDGSTRAGHLLAAHVFPTLEVMVTVDTVPLQKTFDPETGLALIDPAKP